eukprot:scaffold274692_cov31-Tisochrysis_lutea.AAC.1
MGVVVWRRVGRPKCSTARAAACSACCVARPRAARLFVAGLKRGGGIGERISAISLSSSSSCSCGRERSRRACPEAVRRCVPRSNRTDERHVGDDVEGDEGSPSAAGIAHARERERGDGERRESARRESSRTLSS